MRLHDSRRDARVDEAGELVLLEDQDRSRWDRAAIAEGTALVEQALALGGGSGPYTLQAFIAAEHSRPSGPDWVRVAAAYDRLLAVQGGPVVALNRAVAVAMARGPEAGLALMDELASELDGYHLFHSARADLLRRLGRLGDASAAYERALALATIPAERAFLERRLAELRRPSG
jgi:RNA polymerase sigma-70 factor, ECF subfamily